MFKLFHFFVLFVVLSFFWPSLANAQQLDHVQGEIMVRYRKGLTPAAMVGSYRSFRGADTQVEAGRCLSKVHNIWTLSFDWTEINEIDFLQQIRRHPLVEAAQFNHILSLRAIPNDPFYDLQWYFNGQGQVGGPSGFDIGAELAWDITTGGTTANGDTIVVCVLDNGLEYTHEDIAPNLWINTEEIPENGIDDDENGYIDDYYGWNSANRNGDISGDNFHGTRVTGILGAVGNNGVGVTGLNWQVKVMTINAFLGQLVESRIIEGYDYVLRQRRLFNETNGDRGAFVVATNSSWGFPFATEEDAPLWCAIYDTLGQAGILNVVAADNRDIDIDEEGDLPARCSSPFVFAVTSTGRDGAKLNQAGFGATSIDIGAPGIDMYTTFIGESYNFDGGTSMAAPLVTGAVALLYASPCPSLSLVGKGDPGMAALMAKDVLIRSAIPEPSLQDRTVSGGRLHVYDALQLLEAECPGCFPPLSVQVLDRGATFAQLTWTLADDVQQVDLRYRQVGSEQWIVVADVGEQYLFSELQACTTYELQFNAQCSSESTGYGDLITFTTDGCCAPPQDIRFDFIGQQDILMSWASVLAAQSYVTRYRIAGTDDPWTERTTFQTSVGLRSLMECTTYEIQFRVNCASGPSGFGESLMVSTRGCGACLEANYCDVGNLDADNSEFEWIARVQIGDMDNQSTGNGYEDYTDAVGAELGRGQTYTMHIAPDFNGIKSGEYILAWIDFNQDGQFTSDELVFDTDGTTDEAVAQEITLPADIPLGSTRMRIVLQFRDRPGACSFDAFSFFGEVEDYCVTITDDISSEQPGPTPLQAVGQIFPNPTSGQATLQLRLSQNYANMQLRITNLQGQVLEQRELGALPAGDYSYLIDGGYWLPGVYLVHLVSNGQFLQKRLVIFE